MTRPRELMIGEMKRRNYADKTIREYVKHIIYLSRYFGRSPAELTLEDIRQYQLYLCQRKRVSWSYYNGAVWAIARGQTRDPGLDRESDLDTRRSQSGSVGRS